MWYTDLCEYYNVSVEDAIELGTRRSGRKPNLPSSPTCEAVSGKTFEELWDCKPRDTIQKKMDFYKDIGAWQVFRQCNYRKDYDYAKKFYPYLFNGCSIVEYGCGVAPLTNFIIENPRDFDINSMNFSLVDVGGEHLNFAKWRLHKKAPHASFNFHEISQDCMLPVFDRKFDIICVMDVLEHVPNPYDVINNLCNHSNSNAMMVETWVDKSHTASGPDLQEAEDERDITMTLIDCNFKWLSGRSARVHIKRN